MRRVLAVVMMVVGLAGCAAETLVSNRMNLMPKGKSEGYQQGYLAGCRTVVSETCMARGGEFDRDDVRIKSEQDYALGWSDGSRICSCSGTSFVFMPVGK